MQNTMQLDAAEPQPAAATCMLDEHASILRDASTDAHHDKHNANAHNK